MHVSDIYHIINRTSEHSQSLYAFKQFIIINYVSEHQLLHAVDAFHTTPTTHVNRNPMLLKLIERDVIHTLSEFRTYPEPRSNHLALNKVLPLGSQ